MPSSCQWGNSRTRDSASDEIPSCLMDSRGGRLSVHPNMSQVIMAVISSAIYFP